MKRRNFLSLLQLFPAAAAVNMLSGCSTAKEEKAVSNLDFFKSLDFEDGIRVVVDTFQRFPLQYAATLGRDGDAQIRPLEFEFEEDGVLYFDTVEYYESYAELQEHPYIQVCICDQETMTYIRLGGKVNFTKDRSVIDRCFEASPVLTSQFGSNREKVIGYYLTEAWAEFVAFSDELPNRKYDLPNKYDTEAAQ